MVRRIGVGEPVAVTPIDVDTDLPQEHAIGGHHEGDSVVPRPGR